MAKVSFITSLYNCLPLTQEMLASLRATLPEDLEHEIIFIDDGSTDGTRDWLATLPPPCRAILNERNLGFAASNNRAARAATGDLLFFLNNDLVLQPGWFEPMFLLFTLRERLGLVGNRQNAHRDGSLDHCGVRFDSLGRPFHDRRRPWWKTLKRYSRYRAVTAACCAISREVFLDIGGFDEVYRNGYEDIDLCLRLNVRGYRNYVANQSTVLHHVSASPDRFVKENDNLKEYLRRWGPPFRPPRDPSGRELGWSYLSRYWKRPWRYHGLKVALALARIVTNRPCHHLIKRWKLTGATT